jgi:hypothetical protein
MDHIALVGVEAWKQPMSRKEVEASEVGGRQVGDVSDDVGDALRCLGCSRPRPGPGTFSSDLTSAPSTETSFS